jgi:hypothetical protein
MPTANGWACSMLKQAKGLSDQLKSLTTRRHPMLSFYFRGREESLKE